jgi:hypothetical protein
VNPYAAASPAAEARRSRAASVQGILCSQCLPCGVNTGARSPDEELMACNTSRSRSPSAAPRHARLRTRQSDVVGRLSAARDRLTCFRAARSFADLIGTDLPGGLYCDRRGHHRLSIETISRASANDRYRPVPPVTLVRRTTAIGASSPFPRVPAKVTSPNPERSLSLGRGKLVFIPFGDLCRFICSSRRREAAEDRRASGERQTTARWRVSGDCRSGSKDFCQATWGTQMDPVGQSSKVLYCRWVRMEAGEWVQGRW